MSKTIKTETATAVSEVLLFVWDDAKKHILEEFEKVEDALKAWKEGEGLMSGVVGDVLTAWEDFCGEPAEALLKDLYEGMD